MEKRIITAVTAEPLTPALVKMHRRLDSGTFEGGTLTHQCIAPGSHGVAADYGLEGAAVSVGGYETIVNLNAGTCAGTVTAKLKHSDDALVWEDVPGGAFTAVTAANDNAIQTIAYTEGKTYVRVVATVAAAACDFSADVVVKTGESQEDDFIDLLITAAREYCEEYTSRALATQTIEAYLDRFPCHNEIELPYPPLQSVTSVKYTDSAGAIVTLTEDVDYAVDLERNVGRIVLPYGVSWPTATLGTVNPVKIRFTAGYDAENPVPKKIKLAMLALIGHWYENREANADALPSEVERAVRSLLTPYRVKWF